ncbi:unnamed protein product [Penicillium olsonii]|uniref:Uncharacterized protein n=1 Tax=Penicillium olsonii TaxID=99116 RepID=A0A9W4HL12_PENOL|nr:unnamed protein product [Penicillium olsonii]
MDSSSEEIPSHMAIGQSRSLAVNFMWSKMHIYVTDYEPKNPNPKLVYDVNCDMLAPNLKFKSIEQDRQVGTGTIHAISISPDFELHGSKGTLRAKSRLRTMYTHYSHVYSDTGKPAKMSWTSSSGFKTWDFVCCDENQNPVAKFSANVWAVKRFAKIELLGPKALDTAAMDEIVVIGLTLCYCMYMRVNNPLNLLGSAIMRSGKDAYIEPPQAQPTQPTQPAQGKIID